METKLIAALVGVGLLIGAYFYGRHDGRQIERTAWAEREAEINAETAALIFVAAADAAAAEREQGARLLAETTDYYKGLEADREAQDDFVAGVVSGRIRLSVPTKHAPCRDAAGEGAAGAGGVEAEARAELHESAVSFFTGEARRADAYTRQLNAVIGALEACEVVAATP